VWAFGEGYRAFRSEDPQFAQFLRSRLELALGALFRRRREWSAGELVERLALAPAGSDTSLRLVGCDVAASSAPTLGRGVAWEAVREWLERGMIVQVAAARREPGPQSAAAARDSREQAEGHTWPARAAG
jgi:hypothetical protein